MLRVAINGYGRIGRSFLRALYESNLEYSISIVAINEPADLKTIAHLTRYDSTHGRFPGIVEIQQDHLVINQDHIAVFHHDSLNDLPWSDYNIDVVLEFLMIPMGWN